MTTTSASSTAAADAWAPIRPEPSRVDFPLAADANIQGNVLAGFNKDHQMLLFLAWRDADSGRAWLSEVLPRLATNAQVLTFNNRFSEARKSGGGDPENIYALWSNVSFTSAGIRLLAPSAITELENHQPLDAGLQAWLDGSSNATVASSVGDVHASAPDNWLFGATTETIHAIVCVAADRPSDLDVEVNHYREMAAAHHVRIVFEQPGATQPGAAAGHEHFGFKDGISQPGVWGLDPESKDPAHAGEVDGKPGTDLIAAGTFILGYPRDEEAGVAVPQWMFDGSFLTTRRLAQNVPGFWAAVEREHAAMSGPPVTDPTTGIHTSDALAAKLVGRWRSGTPVDHETSFDNRSAQDPHEDNDFDFRDDLNGIKTPACAHIRKVYPRQGATNATLPVTEDDTKKRRIVRRGIPYGLPFEPAAGRGHGVDASRGLVFQCYQASLDEQFVFLQQVWVNNADFPTPSSGPDVVIGTGGSVKIPAGGQDATLTFERFVTTEGSVFSLTPSLATVTLLAEGNQLPLH